MVIAAGVAVAASSAISAGVNASAAGSAASEEGQAYNAASAEERAATQTGIFNYGNWTTQANNTLSNAYSTDTSLEQPYTSAGTDAINQLDTDMQPGGSLNSNFTLADLPSDPGYQFDLQQGQQATEQGAAATGGTLSGGTLKAIDQYTTGLASNELSNAYNRYVTNQNNQYSRLSGIAGIGQSSTGALVNSNNAISSQISSNDTNLGANTLSALSGMGQLIGSNIVNAGAAQAAGTVGTANAISSGVNSAGSAASSSALLSQLPIFGGTGVPQASQSGSSYYPSTVPANNQLPWLGAVSGSST